jgi:hypothetical protein
MYSLSKNAMNLILLLICEVGLLFIGGGFFLVNQLFILVPYLFQLVTTDVYPANFLTGIHDSVLLNIFVCSSIYDSGFTLNVLFVAGYQELKLFIIVFFFNFMMTCVHHSKIRG